MEYIEKFLTETEFEKLQPKIEELISTTNIKFTLQYDEHQIVVFVDQINLDQMYDFIYGETFKQFQLSLEKKFGYLSFSVKKILHANVAPSIGDFVLVESHWSDSIGVITFIRDVNGKKLYGCSYITEDFDSIRGLELTSYDYGGYHYGFAKILTKNEALQLINAKIQKSYEEITERNERLREKMLKDAANLLENLEISKINEKVEMLRFNTSNLSMEIDESLRADFEE